MYPAARLQRPHHSTLARGLTENPRLQKERARRVRGNDAPTQYQCADASDGSLRTNMSGGVTVTQMLAEPPPRCRSWRSMIEHRLAARPNDLIVLDVREKDAFAAGHAPGARICRAAN